MTEERRSGVAGLSFYLEGFSPHPRYDGEEENFHSYLGVEGHVVA
jgi:hypothetical protein